MSDHDKLIKKIQAAEKALDKAKLEYKAYCVDNPLPAPVQPTVHELRNLGKASAAQSESEPEA